MEVKMKISELEKASGTPRSTIHFYVKEGLLPPPDKTGKTMAYYNETHMEKLFEIRKIKLEFFKQNNRSRMSIEAIKNKLAEIKTLENKENPQIQESLSRKNQHREIKKKEIIEAAMKLYLEKGYYQTNLRDIAKAVGMSPSTFYLYFPDKRELFAEIIEQVVGTAIKETKNAWKNEPDENKRVWILYRSFSKYYSKVGQILSQLRAGAMNNDEWARLKIKKILDELVNFFSQVIERGIREKRIRETDPELLSYLIIGGTEIMVQLMALDKKYTPTQILAFWWECVQRILRPHHIDGG